MAFNAATQWEFQTTGDNTNGGGFYNATPGTSVDLALANTPVTFTDLVIDAATNTNITSAARPFTTADAGNIINITSGVNFTVQRVQIVSVSGAIATCDKAVGTTSSTGGNGKMGGAFAIPTAALLQLSIVGNTIWMKTGTYALTESFDPGAGTWGWYAPKIISGYNTTRGDNPTGTNRPVIAAGAYAVTNGRYNIMKNIIITGTSDPLFNIYYNSTGINCKVTNQSTSADRVAIRFDGNYMATCDASSVSGMALFHTSAGIVRLNRLHDSRTGCSMGNANESVLCDNIIHNCSTYGLKLTNYDQRVVGNTLYGSSTPYGIGINGSGNHYYQVITDNIIYGWATGINNTTNDVTITSSERNNFYNNSTDVVNFTKGSSDIALDPQFVSAGSIGSDLCTNGADWTGATGSTPPTGWTVKTAGTFTITAGGQAGNYLKIAHNGTNNNPEISFSFATTAGKSYKITYYAQKGTASNLTAKVGTTSGGSEIGYSMTHTDTDWNTIKVVYFEATAATTYFSVGATTSTNGQYAMVDTVTIYEQGKDFTPGANMKLTIDWTRMGL